MERIEDIAEEAVRLKQEFPELSVLEVIEMAEKMFEREEKEPTADQSK